MANLTDARFDTLRLLYTGATSDMLLAWLQANGATANAIPDAWAEMLAAKLVAAETGDRNTDWHALLIQQGMDVTAGSNQLNDMELAFWVGGAVLPL